NCAGSSTLQTGGLPSGSAFPIGTTTNTFEVTDASGNTTTCSFMVTVNDSENPTLTCPADITSNTTPGHCYASGIALGTLVTGDNCGVAGISNNAPVNFPVGNTLVVWTVTDISGNVQTCEQTVTIVDNENPTISCPMAVTVSTNPGTCIASEVTLGTPLTSDNCTIASVVNDAPANFPIGTTVITWTVTDNFGNNANCTQTVTVADNEDPIITCPSDVTINTDPGDCFASSVSLGTPVVYDNCGVASVTHDAATSFPVGTTVVTWTVTDLSGNTAICTQNVTVIDNEQPSIICPAAITRGTDPGICTATGVSLGTPIISDNCGIASVHNNAPATFPLGTTSVTWTVIDINGNSASCQQSITILDQENPVIFCPDDITQNTDPGQCHANVNVPIPTFSDNCTIQAVTNDKNGGLDASGIYPVGQTIVIWTILDNAGNSAICQTVITITENEDPQIICPSDIIQNTDPGMCNANVNVPIPVTSDNCGVQSVVNDYNGTADASDIFPLGTTTVNWIVTDLYGNTSNCQMLITVVDNELPQIICPSNISLSADPENCQAMVSVPDPVISDNCGVQSCSNDYTGTSDASGTYPVGITTVTWTVIDMNGNTNTCSMNVEVTDDELPVVSCPGDLTAICSVTEVAPYNSWIEFAAEGGNAADNCTLDFSSFALISEMDNGMTCPKTITRTYGIYDVNGNLGVCFQDIVIHDLTPPELYGIPASTQYICEPVPAPPIIGTEITATDNCDSNVDIVMVEESTQQFNNTCDAIIYQITRIWTATDDCGNSTSCQQIIDVICECCNNGIDDDGDGAIDEDDPKCPCSAATFRIECNYNMFYFVPPVWQMNPNYNNNPNIYTNPSGLFIASPFGTAHINIRTADGTTFNESYTVENGNPLEIDLSYNIVQTPNYNTIENDRGLIIETDQLLQVIYRIAADNNKMLVTIKGEQALGMRFRAGSQTNVCGAPNTDKRENHFISVMAVEDNTIVEYDLATEMKGIGTSHSVTLNYGETYLIIDNDNNSSVTGSLITANKPITCVSGSQHSRQCTGGDGRDGGADQLVSSCAIGTEYVIFRGSDDNNPSPSNYANIVGVTSNTQIFINGETTPAAIIGPGDYYTYNMLGPNGSRHYIHTSQPAYLFQFGSVQNNGEIGMAIAAPIDGCRGDKYIEFIRFPNSTVNTVTIIVPNSGLSSLTFNGDPYNWHASAVSIPGLPDWSTVQFDNSDLEDLNIVICEEYFHAAQFVGNTTGGTFGYLTSFKDKIDIFHPVTGQPTVDYFVDTVCGDVPYYHELSAHSCSGNHYISNVIQGDHTANIQIYPNSLTFQYTAETGYTGYDDITVMVTDFLGFTQPVCLSFYVCGAAPVITAPPDVNIQCRADLPAVYTNLASFMTDGGTASDDCSMLNEDSFHLLSDVSDGLSCPETITRTYEIYDTCGMAGQTVHTIVINDVTNPVMVCPSDLNLNTDFGLCFADNVLIGSAIATDNCGVESIVNDAPDQYPVGTTTVIWTATDSCGNFIECAQNITVTDTELPTITCPAGINTTTDTDYCYATIADIGIPVTDDNCGVATVLNDAPPQYSVGTTIVTWTVTDIYGNSNSCQQNIVVEDLQPPTIACPANITQTADSGVCYATILDIGTPVTTDNCSVSSVISNAPSSYPIGSTTVTWTVTDVNGNFSTCDQIITITDDELPTISCPADITANTDVGHCYASGIDLGIPLTNDNCSVANVFNDAPATYPVGTTTVTWTVTDETGNLAICQQLVTVTDNENPTIGCPPAISSSVDAGDCFATNISLGTPLTSDNCGVANVTNNAPVQFPVGTTTIIWTVTDVNGNTATCSQNVTIIDNEDPIIECPAEITVNTDAGMCMASSVSLGIPVTSDNCGVASVTNNAPVQFPVGTTTIIWTVTDLHGNTATCIQNVIVIDNEDPFIICPADIFVITDINQCYASGLNLGNPTATDNCGVQNISNNAPDTFLVGVTTVTWTVLDIYGNTATCDQIISVEDTENPTISCPENLTLPTDIGVCTATGINLGTPFTQDNCGVFSIENNAPATFPQGATTVTWTVTDLYGNIAICTQVITIIDQEPPTFTVPADLTLSCEEDFTMLILTGDVTDEADNCSTNLDAVYLDDLSALTGCSGTGTVVRIWTLTDDSGNTTSQVQRITIEDNMAPIFTAPADITIYRDATCSYDASVAFTGDVTDEADNCNVGEATYMDVVDDTNPCSVVLTRTWSLVDA
ncbi:MAG: HYR domain-containing protein, partial [Bacteroidales bacterium]|nr:HYR domain-containing protein [Bacteroidales bacterium]